MTSGTWTLLDASGVTSVTLAINATAMYVLEGRGWLWRVTNLAGGILSWTLLDKNGVTSFADGPVDGNVYMLESNGTLWRDTIGTGTWTVLDQGVTAFTLRFDGLTLYALDSSGKLWRVDLPSSSTRTWTLIDGNGVTRFAMSADQLSVYALEGNGALTRYDVTTGNSTTMAQGVQWFALSPIATTVDALTTGGTLEQIASGVVTVLDSNVQASWIAAGTHGPRTLYARETNGTVRQFVA
jgi:hypothetical protein